MEEKELKHVIALLLEDAKRLQELEPNAGTEARIWIARGALNSDVESTKSQCDCTQKGVKHPNHINFAIHVITPTPCRGDGVDRVYHDTMVKCLNIEIEKLRSQITINEIVAN